MSANLTIPAALPAEAGRETEQAAERCEPVEQGTRWPLVGAQVLVLMAYGMGIAFLVKTTAGTLVLFSLVAPVLVGIAVVVLIVAGVIQFRRHHGVSRFEVYDRGQIIFRQGEWGDCAYFIQSGEVELIRHANGLENVIARLTEGDYFGEKALINSSPRTVTTRAVTQTRVGIIRKRSFFAMIIVLPTKLDHMVASDRTSKRRKYVW